MKSSFAAAVAAVALVSGAAGAQQAQVAPEPVRYQSVEIKLGTFKPEAGATATPYDSIFRCSSRTAVCGSTAGPMLLFELGAERYLYQGIGAAGVSLSAGYAEKYGRALDTATNAPSAEVAGLFVVPLRLGGVYRFDWAALHYGVPLVPYVKAALVITPWWATKGGEVEVVDGQPGRGAMFGYAGTAGLSFLLDFLEPRLARDFAVDAGVQHSYVFAEFTYEGVNNFGQGGVDLSNRHWMFGVAFDF